jgi:hypothetical protein
VSRRFRTACSYSGPTICFFLNIKCINFRMAWSFYEPAICFHFIAEDWNKQYVHRQKLSGIEINIIISNDYETDKSQMKSLISNYKKIWKQSDHSEALITTKLQAWLRFCFSYMECYIIYKIWQTTFRLNAWGPNHGPVDKNPVWL